MESLLAQHLSNKTPNRFSYDRSQRTSFPYQICTKYHQKAELITYFCT